VERSGEPAWQKNEGAGAEREVAEQEQSGERAESAAQSLLHFILFHFIDFFSSPIYFALYSLQSTLQPFLFTVH